MRKKISGIYTLGLVGAIKVYVGSSSDIVNRFSQHRTALRRGCHHSIPLQNAWNKYGEDAFVFSIVQIVKPCAKTLSAAEQMWFAIFARSPGKPPAYNVLPIAGSTAGRMVSDETKERTRATLLGHDVSKETRAKIGAAAIGRPKSPESVAKIVAKNTGRKRTPEQRARMSAAMTGKKQTDERRAHASRIRIGVPISLEHRERMQDVWNAKRGVPLSAEIRARMSAAAILREQKKRTAAAVGNVELFVDNA